MRYSMTRLQTDVMARLGEMARAHDSSDSLGVPWPEDVVAMKVRSLLPEVGASLIRDAPREVLGSGVALGSGVPSEVAMRLMPCGLYGAEVRLTDGFLRLVSVRMSEWRNGVSEAAEPGSAQWGRQWSVCAGIAGCPESPGTYLDADGEGRLLRLVGSVNATDTLAWLRGWEVPEVSADGEFDFPSCLYPALVGGLARL